MTRDQVLAYDRALRNIYEAYCLLATVRAASPWDRDNASEAWRKLGFALLQLVEASPATIAPSLRSTITIGVSHDQG